MVDRVICRFLFISLHTIFTVHSVSFDAYRSIRGFLCIDSPYVTNYSNVTKLQCATYCSQNQRCQAFATVDGPCQLFVFDACSKLVRDCSCSRRGQVFVKQQPGLEPGALCPSGYGDDLCGTKYRMYDNVSSWFQARAKCESESGLVIMADVVDATEMDFVVGTLNSRYSGGFSYFLGGFQTPGSPEPAGGWYWVACNIAVDGSLWASGEPNNSGNSQNAIGRYSAASDGLADMNENLASRKYLCECVSPFD